jgi:hypothetical protein
VESDESCLFWFVVCGRCEFLDRIPPNKFLSANTKKKSLPFAPSEQRIHPDIDIEQDSLYSIAKGKPTLKSCDNLLLFESITH